MGYYSFTAVGKHTKTSLKVLGATVLLLLILIFSVVGLFLFSPRFFINDTNLARVAAYLRPRQVFLVWKSAHLQARSLNALEKEISFTAQHFCFKLPSSLDFCAERVHLDLTISFSHFIPRLLQLGPIDVKTGKLVYRAPASERTNSEKQSPDYFQSAIPRWLSGARLGVTHFELASYQVTLATTSLTGDALLNARSSGQSSLFALLHHSEIRQRGQSLAKLSGDISLRSTASVWNGPYRLRLLEKGTALGNRPAVLETSITESGTNRLLYDLRADIGRGAKEGLHAKISGEFAHDRFHATIQVEFSQLLDNVSRITVSRCELEINPTKRTSMRMLSLKCPILVVPKPPYFDSELPATVCSEIRTLLTATLSLPADLASTSQIKGRIDLALDTPPNSAIKATGGTALEVDGNLTKLPLSLNPKIYIDAALHIPDFQNLVAQLGKNSAWSVPEPFRSLQGTIQLEAKQQGEHVWPIENLPIKFTTRLHSQLQSLNIDAEGLVARKLREEKSIIDLEGEIKLSDIRIVLPHLSLVSQPRFLPDSRIKIRPVTPPRPKSSSASAFHYRVSVLTPKEKPIRFHSDLASGDIPLTLNLVTESGRPVEIKFSIADFPLALFRRKATVEYFSIQSFVEKKGLFLDGKIKVGYTDYLITIEIGGTTDAPAVKFTSEPPLAQTQIMAVLLFGKPVEQLEPGQMDSVASAKAAVTDGAVSLASMYLLASTPVESIGYNPSSGIMTARVRLTDGTSLNVGSNLNQTNTVGLRRRLGPNWAIASYLDNPFNATNRSFGTFLEWNRRY